MLLLCFLFFFFNDTATTEIYTLSLHDALPIFGNSGSRVGVGADARFPNGRAVREVEAEEIALFGADVRTIINDGRSEEHTSELQSQSNLVCRLLLEKKKKKKKKIKNIQQKVTK